MKLSNYIREAFVSAAMQDVPEEIDHAEAIREIATDDILSQMPELIKKAWEDEKARQYLKECYSSFDSVSICHPDIDSYRHKTKLTEKAQIKIDKLIAEMNIQRKSRKELSNKLKNIAYSVNTLKQLKELLPEFVKYMPEDGKSVSTNLPALTNVVADFVKAGWPKKESK